ncbi:hypothetical protein BpHYR1_040808 [Brachionus plicatilis]|uniref:Uncharacterized protein n=1 Tax=Brachionus plicatilis TaxID=10195 RepID=A0A3M7PUZ5_BRAPC|nr:hypothetical protein BpHYR1_040808 [Brachionus plicatilis]
MSDFFYFINYSKLQFKKATDTSSVPPLKVELDVLYNIISQFQTFPEFCRFIAEFCRIIFFVNAG